MSDLSDVLRDLKVEQRPISSLRPYKGNPRTHSPAQIDKLARAIVEFGWTNRCLSMQTVACWPGMAACLLPSASA